MNRLFLRIFMYSNFLSNYHWPAGAPTTFTHINPAIFDLPTPFSHTPIIHWTYIMCFNILLVNFFQTNIFSFWKRYQNRNSQVAVFSVFIFVIDAYSERGKKWHRTTQRACSDWNTGDERQWEKVSGFHEYFILLSMLWKTWILLIDTKNRTNK